MIVAEVTEISRLLTLYNAELNPICHLMALLGAHRILHVSRVRVNNVCCSMFYHWAFVSLTLIILMWRIG